MQCTEWLIYVQIWKHVGRKLLKTVQTMTTFWNPLADGPPGNPSWTPFGPRTPVWKPLVYSDHDALWRLSLQFTTWLNMKPWQQTDRQTDQCDALEARVSLVAVYSCGILLSRRLALCFHYKHNATTTNKLTQVETVTSQLYKFIKLQPLVTDLLAYTSSNVFISVIRWRFGFYFFLRRTQTFKRLVVLLLKFLLKIS